MHCVLQTVLFAVQTIYLYIHCNFSGPEVLLKNCVAMKFVDDDDDDEFHLRRVRCHNKDIQSVSQSVLKDGAKSRHHLESGDKFTIASETKTFDPTCNLSWGLMIMKISSPLCCYFFTSLLDRSANMKHSRYDFFPKFSTPSLSRF